VAAAVAQSGTVEECSAVSGPPMDVQMKDLPDASRVYSQITLPTGNITSHGNVQCPSTCPMLRDNSRYAATQAIDSSKLRTSCAGQDRARKLYVYIFREVFRVAIVTHATM
jgi:hypothetical protein